MESKADNPYQAPLTPSDEQANPLPLVLAEQLIVTRRYSMMLAGVNFHSPDKQRVGNARQLFRFWKFETDLQCQTDVACHLRVTAQGWFGGKYIVRDQRTGKLLGTLEGFRHHLWRRQPWLICDASGATIGVLSVSGRSYYLQAGERTAATLNITPWGVGRANFSSPGEATFPRPLALAAILVAMALHHGVVS